MPVIRWIGMRVSNAEMGGVANGPIASKPAPTVRLRSQIKMCAGLLAIGPPAPLKPHQA